ncbi:MAG: efflux RND transporter periplasmic adaptor subunit [Candidatus Gracilibacteria bacterium]|nr:efflux RND transporter periplasmic adaptor subunit [Candidatus Gracilibacteria bacterium]
MKFNFNLKYFISGMIIILLINYNTFIPATKTTNETNSSSTVKAKVGDIIKTIEVSGVAELVDEQNLKFNKTGTITKVNFKAGDSVKKGDIIAEIDNSDGYVSIEEAKINLDNSLLLLQDLMEGADESQILQSKSNIDNAEKNIIIAEQELINLKNSQKLNLSGLNEDISNAEKELEISKNNLEISKNDLDLFIREKTQSLGNSEINKSTTIKNIEESFKTYLIDIEKNIDELDSILGYSDKYKDEVSVYEIYLGAKNSNYKGQAKSFLASSILLYDDLAIEIAKYDNNGNIDDIEYILNQILNVFNELYNANDYTYKTVDNSIVSVGSINQSDIDSMKSSTLNYRTNTSNKISSINSTINNLSTLTDLDLISETNKNSIIAKQESIKSQELNLEKQSFNLENSKKLLAETIKTYELSIVSKENDISSKKTNLEILKLNLEDLLEGATASNISKANNSIKQSQLKLDSAYKNLEDYTLVAPFDGVIRKIDYMVGDNITTDTDKYVYIENPNLLEITVMLDQIDIVGVKLGMQSTITFDAYSTTPVNAIISSIDTTPTSTSGVVSYEVKLVLDDDNFTEKILSGFTADVEIITESKEDILLLKTSAITEKDGKYFVNLVKDGKQVETQVETGIASDGMTEIISGINEGDEVSLTTFVSTTTTEEETSTSLFSPPTGGNRSGNMSGPPGGF